MFEALDAVKSDHDGLGVCRHLVKETGPNSIVADELSDLFEILQEFLWRHDPVPPTTKGWLGA